jgi:AraC-like DNA-binding protein
VHLLWGLEPLLKAAERRWGPRGGGEGLREQAAQALDQALTAGELLRGFQAQVEDLLARLQAPAQGALAQRLRRAAAQLQQHPESEQGLGGLAREAGLSPYHFSRQFKRHAGMGFAQARLQARLSKARKLLRESPLPIAAVAAECGFRNAAHFSTAFKKEQGVSPKAFRAPDGPQQKQKNKIK